ncbi:MAG TPA: tetratricopeptide repeat protein [Candidatus Limnocylindria bacterium]|nr:tetratricopeptide repeat protein [Candidatus Limnocylindria bacterium]
MANAVRSPMVADVGARIRSLRIAKGLTQAQLAEPNYTKAYVSMLESGRTRASMKALEHMAGVLGVTPADLLGGPAGAALPQYDLLEARRLVEQGKPEDAVPILERLEEGLPPTDQVVRLRYLGSAYSALGRPKDAFPILERAQRMADMLGDVEEQARLKSVLAAVFRRTYAYDESAKLLREVIELCESGAVKDPAFHFRRVVDLAVILTNQRQSKAALAMFERAIALSESLGDRATFGLMYAAMAKAYHDSGDVEAAIRYNQRSLQVYEELGILAQIACTLDNAALLYAEYGNRERARECLERGARIAQESGSAGTLASLRVTEAEVMAKGDPAEALEAAQEALRFAKKIDQPDAQVRALILIGELRMPSSVATARRSFNEAAQMAEARVPHLLRVVYDRWSRAAETSGDGEEALRLARRALELVRA